MAVVYLAFDAVLEQWVAAKVMLPSLASRPDVRARFEIEARSMMRIDHRHVVRVFDVDSNAPLPYIVMEYADGGCLVD